MLVATITFRGTCRIPLLSKTKLLVKIVSTIFTFKLLPQAYRLHPRCSMDPRSTSEFSEICNGKVFFAAKYKVAFNIRTVISYDSVVLTLIAEN